MDILEASGAFDLGSNPSRGALTLFFLFLSDFKSAALVRFFILPVRGTQPLHATLMDGGGG